MSIIQGSGPASFRAAGARGAGARNANGAGAARGARAGMKAGASDLFSVLNSDDPVAAGLRASVKRMGGIAVFSGVINILMLAGSLYMLQVYDRVIPSRNIATLIGLSLMVLVAYCLQGYFDALR